VTPELLAICLIAAYLFGSIPTGYLVAKQLKGIDIREHGSGNTGATNVKRVVGNKAGLFVLVFDFFKGFAPVFFLPYLQGSLLPQLAPEQLEPLRIAVALLCSLGHSKSVFLKFTGGKAAITTLGGLLGLEPLIGLCLGVIAFIIIKTTRMVSVGSITGGLLSPVLVYFFSNDPTYSHFIFALCGGLFVVYLHKANIGRLLNGTENRI
jgi:glycerol-3-phosphate acyltransferase PlsY